MRRCSSCLLAHVCLPLSLGRHRHLSANSSVSHPLRWCGAIGGFAIEKNGRSSRVSMTFRSNASLQILIYSSGPQHGCSSPALPTCYFLLLYLNFLLQVRCVAATHTGALVSSSRDCNARLWFSVDGKLSQSDSLQLIGHEKSCASCCAIPPCTRFPAGAVATASHDSSIIIWDNCEPALTLLGHTQQVLLI
jgi:WD40 repeat protein